ncbi:hypothetical protein KFU94_56715 [Chloroflexi bacterium TSY]|nr:hypothetical protein [Chloroflexi bacterium TSY]
MGNFSRDPATRLENAIAKHYVGVRMQQGVPLLDADWNELEDLRKYELQSLIKHFIGDGVPSDSDGFRIEALAGGGVGTIVLKAKVVSSTTAFSSLEIDFSNSTASSRLGFFPGSSSAAHIGSAPARLTGNAVEPFQLASGLTLTVRTTVVHLSSSTNQFVETITFSADDFADIALATAEEVVAILNTELFHVEAEIGQGNDFLIRGGDGSSRDVGRLLVNGCEAINETHLNYSSQPLYENPQLASRWGVDVVEELSEPTAQDRTDLVYIDVWEREVTADEDNALILPEVGLETTVRQKREWAVRVTPNASEIPDNEMVLGHHYLSLALLQRTVANEQGIPQTSIVDLRKRQLTLADVVTSPILVKGPLGLDRVNSGLFAAMLQKVSEVYGYLLESDYFLANNFRDITTVESVQVLKAFQDVRTLAEVGYTDSSLKRFDNQSALAYLYRLYTAQRSLVDAMMELASDNPLRADTEIFLQRLDTWLDGNGTTIPGLRRSVTGESADLGDAYEAQIFINSRLGLPQQGLLEIRAISVPSGNIHVGTSHEFVYAIHSRLSLDDTMELALTDTQDVFDFAFTELDENPHHPGDSSRALLPLEKDQTVNVTFNLRIPPGLAEGTQSRIVLTARSQLNPDEVDFANLEILVTVGSLIAMPATDLALTLLVPEINLATDVVAIGRGSQGNHVRFQVEAEHLIPAPSPAEEFIFTVDFIGASDAFEVLGASTLEPFNLPASVPQPKSVPIGATDSAVDGQESLMVIRLSKTDPGLTEPFFKELHIQVITDIIT